MKKRSTGNYQQFPKRKDKTDFELVPKTFLMRIIFIQTILIGLLVVIIGVGVFYLRQSYKLNVDAYNMQQQLNSRYYVEYNSTNELVDSEKLYVAKRSFTQAVTLKMCNKITTVLNTLYKYYGIKDDTILLDKRTNSNYVILGTYDIKSKVVRYLKQVFKPKPCDALKIVFTQADTATTNYLYLCSLWQKQKQEEKQLLEEQTALIAVATTHET